MATPDKLIDALNFLTGKHRRKRSKSGDARSGKITEDERWQLARLIDPAYYLTLYPDVAQNGMDPLQHYLDYGWRENRNPSASFDTAYYRHSYLAGIKPEPCPLLHYLRNGAALEADPGARKPIRDEAEVFENLAKSGITDLVKRLGLGAEKLPGMEALRLIVKMFSTDFYKKEARLPGAYSRLDLLKRYLLFDYPRGLAPGPLFNSAHYRFVAAQAGLPPIGGGEAAVHHWVKHGIPARLAPTSLYDEADYLRLNPDLERYPGWVYEHFVVHGLDEARQFSTLFGIADQPVNGRTISSGRIRKFICAMEDSAEGKAYFGEIRGFLNSDLLADIYLRANKIDPNVGERLTSVQPVMPALHSLDYWKFVHVLERLPQSQYESVVLVPFCKLGGADFVAGILSRVLAESGPTLVMRTDQSEWARPDWFPEIDTVDISVPLSDFAPGKKSRVMYEIIRYLKPRRVINVNSRVGFEFLAHYGLRAKTFVDLYAYYFCADRNPAGLEVGYPVQYFANVMPALKGALIDNKPLAQSLCDRYSLPSKVRERLHVVYSPASDECKGEALVHSQLASAPARVRPVLLWAGRFDRQKRFDLLQDIARQMPDIDFICWGKAVLDAAPDLDASPDNLSVRDPFLSYEELPLELSDGWLYTSSWDGIPTILIECGQRGIPLVASAVGGVAELVDEKTGWPLSPGANTEDYVTAIREMLADSDERVLRATALQKRVRERHQMARYKDHISQIIAEDVGEI